MKGARHALQLNANMKYKQYSTKYCLPHAVMFLTTVAAMGGTETTVTDSSLTTPDWLKVSGYGAVSYSHTNIKGAGNDDTFFHGGTPLDAVKLGLEASKGPLSAYASLFYSPTSNTDTFGAGGDAGILDAYATYKMNDFSITGGKYVSYLGYEAFDTVNMSQLTYANSSVGAIPAYHTGVKIDYTHDIWSAGFSISDSIRGNTFWGGDGNWSNGLGYEAFVSYKGIDQLTLWAGAAYDTSGNTSDFSCYDFWASYDLTDKITVAGEVAYSEHTLTGVGSDCQSLAVLKYAFTKNFSNELRFGLDQVSSGGNDNFKTTISPTYHFNEHLLVRAELSYTNSADDIWFSGVQALLKF